jgi:hypothetical protein
MVFDLGYYDFNFFHPTHLSRPTKPTPTGLPVGERVLPATYSPTPTMGRPQPSHSTHPRRTRPSAFPTRGHRTLAFPALPTLTTNDRITCQARNIPAIGFNRRNRRLDAKISRHLLHRSQQQAAGRPAQ